MFEDSKLLDNDSAYQKQDIRLLLKAINGGWEIPTCKKQEIVQRLLQLTQHIDPRTSVNACNALIKIGAMQQADIHLLLKLQADSEKPVAPMVNINLGPEDKKIVDDIVARSFPKELSETSSSSSAQITTQASESNTPININEPPKF